MINDINIQNLPFSWLIAVIVIILISVPFGTIGYFIATRRIKQPITVFMARFGIAFFVLFFLEYLILNALPSVHTTMQEIAVRLISGILNLAGASHIVVGSTITLQNPYLAFDITVACLGGLLLWIYIALVLAEKSANNRQRLVGILLGLAVLLVFNFVRIILSIYMEWQTGFGMHNLFYVLNMVFILLIWTIWLRTTRTNKSRLKTA